MDYRRRFWLGMLLCLSGMLVACGGGGGGGGGSPAPAGSFTLSTTTVSFSGKHLGANPANQAVLVHLTGSGIATVGAGYANGVQPPSWLTVTYTGTAPDFTFTLTVNTTAMTSGTYSTTLTFGTADSSNNILQTQPVQVTYTLRDGLAINANSVSTSLTAGDSAATASLPFTVISPATIQWTAQSDSPWLTAPSGTQQGSGSFQAAVNMTGLGAGTYNGKITLTNSADSTDTASIAVTITMIVPTLTAPSSIIIGGASGLDMSAQTLTFSINTHQNAFPWTATVSTAAGGSWFNLGAASGTVSGGSTTVNINDSRTLLATGTYQGQIQLQVTVNGSVLTQTIPVTLNIDVNRLVVSAIGVGFSSFPSRSVLTRTLNVANSWGVAGVHWQTQSDQGWLTATSSGTTGAPLVLTANPSGLAPGQYTAHVTITSPDTGVSNQETVRVGLTVGTTDPAPLITVPSVSGNAIAVSPVEPVVFVTMGVANAPIYVYDLNTGALLNTFTTGFTTPGNLAISGDGLTLFVSDNTSGSWALRVLDATTGALQTSYPISSASGSLVPTVAGYPQLAYVRPNGHPLLLYPQTNQAFDTATGASYPINTSSPNGAGIGDGAMAVSPDQTTLYHLQLGFFPAYLSAYSIAYSTLPGVALVTKLVNQATSGGSEIAVSGDGTRVYSGSSAEDEFAVFNAALVQQTSLAAAVFPVSVTTSWNGLVAGGADKGYDPDNIWIYDSQGNLLEQALSNPSGQNSLTTRSLRFSADGTRLANLSDAAGLEIRATPLPPP